jgi:shikimate dehydrogenase
LYDLVYNPSETAFLKEGARRGAKTMNGLAMLQAQAEAAWNIWQIL